VGDEFEGLRTAEERETEAQDVVMSAKVTNISERRPDANYSALEAVALEILAERDKTEREIIELLKEGKDREVLKRLREYWNIEPRLKVVK